MKKVILSVISAILIATFGCLLFACNPVSAPKLNVLVIGTTMTVDSLNRLDAAGGAPGYNFDKIASSVSQITAVSKIDGAYVGVACDLSVSDDKKTVTLTLKDGFKWHDGKAVSVDDVEYTLRGLKEGEDYIGVTGQGNSLIFTVDIADAFLAKVAAETIVPKHIFEGKTKETLTDAESVIGAGPFRFSGVDKAAGTISFEKFEGYPKASDVKFDKVVFKKYGSQEVLVLALKNGEIDMIFDYAKGLTADAISALSGQSNVRLVSQATKQINKVMFFNNRKMTNANVKRAIALSVDFDKIRATFASDGAAPAREGFVGEGIFGYKETPIWARNLEKAKELLTAEGYSGSNKFRFEILVHSGTDDTQYADLLKTQIEETGLVNVVLIEKGSDWQQFYQNGNQMASFAKITAKGYDFDAGYGTKYTLAASTSMCAQKPNPVAHGQMICEDEDGNFTAYGKILADMNGAKTEAELKSAVERYQDFMVENVICVPFFYDGITFGTSSTLDGFRFDDGASGILNVVTFETLKRV